MSRKIRPDGRKHSIPRSLYDFFSDLEARTDINAVKGGRFIHRGRVRNFQAQIQHYREYNNSGGTLRVRVQNRGFIAYFNLDIIDGAAKDVIDYIQGYRMNRYGGNGSNGANGH